MAFSDTMKVVARDLSGFAYNGKPLRKSDVLTIDPGIPRIMFRMPLDIKALNFASSTEVVLADHSKVVHIMAAGRLVSLGNLFCGSLEAGSDIIVKGDLVTWLGDVETTGGNIFVSGDLNSAHRIIAPDGAVIVNGEAAAESEPQAKFFWEGSSGKPLPDQYRVLAQAAGRAIKAITKA